MYISLYYLWHFMLTDQSLIINVPKHNTSGPQPFLHPLPSSSEGFNHIASHLNSSCPIVKFNLSYINIMCFKIVKYCNVICENLCTQNTPVHIN